MRLLGVSPSQGKLDFWSWIWVKPKKYQTSTQWLETMHLRLKFQSCFLSGNNKEGRRGLEQPVRPGEDSLLPQCPSGQGQVGERFGGVQTNSWVEVVVKVPNLNLFLWRSRNATQSRNCGYFQSLSENHRSEAIDTVAPDNAKMDDEPKPVSPLVWMAL